jgi:hypothetical protein
LTEADTFDKLKDAVRYSSYEPMIAQVTDIPSKEKASEFSSSGKSIGKLYYFIYKLNIYTHSIYLDDVMFTEKMRKMSMAFEN